MATSSASSSARRVPNPALIVCFCQEPTLVRTSWSKDNPGRRFRSCPNYDRGYGCGFFKWEDPPMCARAVAIIPGLLCKKNKLEAEIVEVKVKKNLYGALLGLTWMFITWKFLYF